MSSAVRACDLPPRALLQRYATGEGFTDCYVTELDGAIAQAAFIEAFYTTALFKLERVVLTWLAARPSSDAEARQLSLGAASRFAAWTVEAQDAEQLLLADVTGRTRSWLMAAPAPNATTRLYFGSAVVPVAPRSPGAAPRMGWSFRALLGLHRLYAKALLRAARARLSSHRLRD
jgi:hypothetical protein